MNSHYTVIALYPDNTRFAETYAAQSAAEAEDMAVTAHPELIVAGVVEGRAVILA